MARYTSYAGMNPKNLEDNIDVEDVGELGQPVIDREYNWGS